MTQRVRKNFDLSAREAEVLAELAKVNDLSENRVMRQALILYQLVYERTKNGETMSFSGDPQRTFEFVGMHIK